MLTGFVTLKCISLRQRERSMGRGLLHMRLVSHDKGTLLRQADELWSSMEALHRCRRHRVCSTTVAVLSSATV
jgi:hypothetical protein